MKTIFQRNNHISCLANICVCLLCSTYMNYGYNDINNNVHHKTEDAVVEKESDPLSDSEKKNDDNLVKENNKVAVNDATQNNNANNIVVKKTNQTTKNNSVVKTTTKKTVSSSKKNTGTKTYVKPKYDSVTGDAIVNYAKKYLGLRYVSGGNSLTKGTDCSGFTKLIYKEFGINLSRSVKSQVYNGSYVKKSDLKKGDLVFYGQKKGAVSHVGIYIGNGKVLHQSNPRDGVKISPVNMMVYITARRVITKPSTVSPTIKNEENKVDNSVSDNNSTNIENNNTNINNGNNNSNNQTNIEQNNSNLKQDEVKNDDVNNSSNNDNVTSNNESLNNEVKPNTSINNDILSDDNNNQVNAQNKNESVYTTSAYNS